MKKYGAPIAALRDRESIAEGMTDMNDQALNGPLPVENAALDAVTGRQGSREFPGLPDQETVDRMQKEAERIQSLIRSENLPGSQLDETIDKSRQDHDSALDRMNKLVKLLKEDADLRLRINADITRNI